MNKLTKITVVSAVLITSGFTQQHLTATLSDNVRIEAGAVMELGKNVEADMADGVTIHNYGTVQGPAATGVLQTDSSVEKSADISNLNNADKAVIDGGTTAEIINYNHIMERAADGFAGLDGVTVNNPVYYMPTGGGKVLGAVDTTSITVKDEISDLKVSIDNHNESNDVMLLRTDNCSETTKEIPLTNTGNKMNVNANIANELVNGEGNAHSISVNGDFVFNGDQSHFNQDGTKWNVNGGSSNIAATNAFPQTEVNVNNGSELNINAPGVVTASKNVTVKASQLNIGKTSTLKLGKGVTLWFKGSTPPWIVKAGTDLSKVTDGWENYATWLLLERAAGSDSDVFCFRANNTNVEIVETNVALVYDESADVLSLTPGDNAPIKGSKETGYQKGAGENIVLDEIEGLIADGKTWQTFSVYTDGNKFRNAATDRNIDSAYKLDPGETSVVIPYGVKRIGDYAFFGCDALKNIYIPSSITSIGTAVFVNCFALASIQIPNSVTTIGERCFGHCKNLISITLPDKITTIEYMSFIGCEKLTSITLPNAITSIGEEAFSMCVGLTNVTIPASVTTIESSAFDSSGLESITFLSITDLPTFGTSVFDGCDYLTTVTVTQALYNSRGEEYIKSKLNTAGATYITTVNVQ